MENILKNKKINYTCVSLEESYNGYILYSKCKIDDKFDEDKESLYDHFKYVYENCKDFKSITNCGEDYTYRYNYYLDMGISEGKHATIIMANPAFAYSKDTDKTISNIINYFQTYSTIEKFKSFDIVNLYPVRMPKLNCLDCFNWYLEFNEENIYYKLLDEYLKKKSDSGSILIAAWGDKYNTVAQDIFKNSGLKFKSYKKGAPAHFSTQRYNNVKDKGLYDFILFTPTEMDA